MQAMSLAGCVAASPGCMVRRGLSVLPAMANDILGNVQSQTTLCVKQELRYYFAVFIEQGIIIGKILQSDYNSSSRVLC